MKFIFNYFNILRQKCFSIFRCINLNIIQKSKKEFVQIIFTLIIVIVISFLFQKRITTNSYIVWPDTESYLQVAQALSSGIPDESTTLRTPGFPLIILLVAHSTGISVNDIKPSFKEFSKHDEISRKIVSYHRIMGFLIPVFTFIIFALLANSLWIGVLCSFAYILDFPSVQYQNVILTETSTIFFLWLSFCCGILFFLHPNKKKAIMLGLLVGITMYIRPQYLIIVFSLFFSLAIWCIQKLKSNPGFNPRKIFHWFISNIKSSPKFVLKFFHIDILLFFILTFSLFHISWSFYNFIKQGKYSFSVCSSATQMHIVFSDFMKIDVKDKELKILQNHFKANLKSDDANPQQHVPTDSEQSVRRELGINHFEYWDLVGKAAGFIIKSNFKNYLIYLHNGFFNVWERQFDEELLSTEEMYNKIFSIPVISKKGFFIFQKNRFFWFIILSYLLFVLIKDRPRKMFFLFMFFTIIMNILGVVVVESRGNLRQCVGTHSFVNAVYISGICLLVKEISIFLYKKDFYSLKLRAVFTNLLILFIISFSVFLIKYILAKEQIEAIYVEKTPFDKYEMINKKYSFDLDEGGKKFHFLLKSTAPERIYPEFILLINGKEVYRVKIAKSDWYVTPVIDINQGRKKIEFQYLVDTIEKKNEYNKILTLERFSIVNSGPPHKRTSIEKILFLAKSFFKMFAIY